MPTYEYACRSCGEHLEIVQSFRDEPLTECPVCGGTLRKVFSPVGISFKGSGFYRTDSRSSSKPASDRASSDKSSEKTEKTVKTEKTEKSEKKDSAGTSNTEAKSA
jgi:putative FmdB family regulatory protein